MNDDHRPPFRELPLSVRAWIIISGLSLIAAFIFTCSRYYGWLGFEGTKQHRAQSIADRQIIKD